jgi:hypothetical protein
MPTGARRLRTLRDAQFRLTNRGQTIEVAGVKCYVVNSGMTGTGIAISQTFSITDGLLDVFVLARNLISLMAAAERLLHVDTPTAGFHYWQGRTIRVEAEPTNLRAPPHRPWNWGSPLSGRLAVSQCGTASRHRETKRLRPEVRGWALWSN